MNIEIYADGSSFTEMVSIYNTKKFVTGFTTNPSLMRKEKIDNYISFVEKVTAYIKDLPISFEVFADDLPEMKRQAKLLAGFGKNIFVKIPVTNTRGESTKTLIKSLLEDAIMVNITAVFTIEQIDELIPYLQGGPVILSIFAGRIADTGIDPKPIINHGINSVPSNVKILWASPREIYNVYEADQIGCHIITISQDILKKLELKNKNLTEYSLETVKMFYDDAKIAGYVL